MVSNVILVSSLFTLLPIPVRNHSQLTLEHGYHYILFLGTELMSILNSSTITLTTQEHDKYYFLLVQYYCPYEKNRPHQNEDLGTDLPSLLDISPIRPFMQDSLTSLILLAHLPIAWMVAATNSLSELVT